MSIGCLIFHVSLVFALLSSRALSSPLACCEGLLYKQIRRRKTRMMPATAKLVVTKNRKCLLPDAQMHHKMHDK